MKITKYKALLFILTVTLSISPILSTFGKTVYTGEVVPMVKNSIQCGTDYGNAGTLIHASKAGDIVYPSIFDAEGNTVKQGTVIVQLKKAFWEEQWIAAEADVITNDENLKRMKNLIGVKDLEGTNVESLQEFQAVQDAYLNSLAELNEAKLNVIQARNVMDGGTQVAPFEAIVDKVYYTQGKAIGNPQVMEISLLNPIGIKVEMPREAANKILPNTPVAIYPVGENNPRGVIYGYSILKDDGIQFMTLNRPKYVRKDQEIKENYPVTKFYVDKHPDSTLAVPVKYIFKDDTGSYVWKAVGQKTMDAGKGLDVSFKINKVYVKPEDLITISDGFCYVQAIQDNSSLEVNDVVVLPSEKSKNDEMVSIHDDRYTFMPGEKVKVVIGE